VEIFAFNSKKEDGDKDKLKGDENKNEDDEDEEDKVKEEENENFKEYKFLKDISKEIGIERVMMGIAVLRDFDI
jgi:ABC-type uncharacterized transport system substrate-binding protein